MFKLLNQKKNSHYNPPEKPFSLEAKIDKIWDAVFTDIVTKLYLHEEKVDGLNTKVNWVMVLMGLLLASMSCLIGVSFKIASNGGG